jgi:hypothetical protein
VCSDNDKLYDRFASEITLICNILTQFHHIWSAVFRSNYLRKQVRPLISKFVKLEHSSIRYNKTKYEP